MKSWPKSKLGKVEVDSINPNRSQMSKVIKQFLRNQAFKCKVDAG